MASTDPCASRDAAPLMVVTHSAGILLRDIINDTWNKIQALPRRSAGAGAALLRRQVLPDQGATPLSIGSMAISETTRKT